MKRVSIWYSYREHPTDICQGCEGWEESMLNMASEQRTESDDVHKCKRRIAAMLHVLGTASRLKSTRYLIRLRQGSPVIATGYKAQERVPVEVLFVRTKRIKVVTRVIISSLFIGTSFFITFYDYIFKEGGLSDGIWCKGSSRPVQLEYRNDYQKDSDRQKERRIKHAKQRKILYDNRNCLYFR